MTAAAALVLQGCSDWDDHYNATNDVAGADATLWEQIQNRPELSNFATLLKKVDYDKLLSTSQSFTIWAPNNNAYDFNKYDAMSDSLLKAEFINNHIARGYHRATGEINERIHLLNKKVMDFEGNGSYTIGKLSLDSTNILCKNGLMHLMTNMMDFRPNLYEFFERENESNFDASALGKIFKSKMKREIDKANSVEGPMKDGELTYLDTVYVESNTLFNNINAYLNDEDSTYTMIVPSNKAWEKAYQKVSEYYKYPASIQPFTITNDEKTGKLTYTVASLTNVEADSLKDEYTTRAILEPLIYSHSINQVLREKEYPNSTTDSIKSTTGDIICNTLSYNDENRFIVNDATDMFQNATRQTVSNGYAWKTDSIRIKPWNSWCPVIHLRAQNGTYQAGIDNVALAQNVTVSSSERNPKVHGSMHSSAYYQVSSTVGSRPDVYFYIPKVWSTSYAVYLTMVPANITDTTATPTEQKIQIRSIMHANSGKANSTLAPSPLKKDFGMNTNFAGATFSYGDIDDSYIVSKYMGVFTPTFCYRNLTTSPEVYPAFNIRTTTIQKGESTVLRIAGITLVPMDAVLYYQKKGLYEDYTDDMPELFWHLTSYTY